MHITYCTTLAVESKLKKTRIPENVILGNVRDMIKDDDVILEELTSDPYSPAYTDAVFHALDFDGPEYSTVDAYFAP